MMQKTIVTHDGGFHADDVFAVAALLLYLKGNAHVVRTREWSIIDRADFVIDVGDEYAPERNRFDHHQPKGAGVRESGIPYAAFGLVWKKFGLELAGSPEAARRIDVTLVAPLDAHDNGVSIFLPTGESGVSPYGLPEMVKAFRPSWDEETGMDERFTEAVSIAEKLLLREIVRTRSALRAERLVGDEYERAADKCLVVLSEDYPWQETLARHPEPLFVVHPQEAVWYVECVRDDPNSFINRKDLPERWAGLRGAELARVTGVADAVFAHRNLFMAVARSRDGAMALAKLALSA